MFRFIQLLEKLLKKSCEMNVTKCNELNVERGLRQMCRIRHNINLHIIEIKLQSVSHKSKVSRGEIITLINMSYISYISPYIISDSVLKDN